MRMGIGLGVGINRSNYAQGIFSAYQSRVIADGGVTEAGACVDAVSGLLQSASLLLIPSGYKSGKAYAEIPTNGNGDLTWTRASTALRTNSSGLLESMASGVPRLSYMYGSCPSALLEPQRTNINTKSNDFTIGGGFWYDFNGKTPVANQGTSPDGTNNAWSIPVGSLLGTEFGKGIGGTIGDKTAASIWAKGNETAFRLYIQNVTNTDIIGTVTVNLTTGAITSGSGTVQSFNNGWYRITTIGTSTITNGSPRTIMSNPNSSCLIYGSQFEAGAYPTTYIPTTSATATRVADSFSRSNIYTNGLISASGGTWFVELRNNVAYTRDATTRLGIGDTTALTTNSIQFGVSSGGSFRLQIVTFVSGSGATIYTTTTDTTKIAIKWNGSTADIFANGTKVVTATSFTPTNMENLATNGIGVPFFIQQMALFNSPLTDTQCQTLTTL